MSGIEDCGYDDDDDDEHAVVAGGGKDDDDDDDANHHSDDDFAYVNVTEMDADGLDDMDLLMMDGGECDVGGLAAPPTQEPPRRGDVLAVLLSGMQRGDGDALMVGQHARGLCCAVSCCVVLSLLLRVSPLLGVTEQCRLLAFIVLCPCRCHFRLRPLLLLPRDSVCLVRENESNPLVCVCSSHHNTPFFSFACAFAPPQNQAESANEAALRASEAKKQGDLLAALDFHTQAAKLYKDSALSIRDRNCELVGPSWRDGCCCSCSCVHSTVRSSVCANEIKKERPFVPLT